MKADVKEALAHAKDIAGVLLQNGNALSPTKRYNCMALIKGKLSNLRTEAIICKNRQKIPL